MSKVSSNAAKKLYLIEFFKKNIQFCYFQYQRVSQSDVKLEQMWQSQLQVCLCFLDPYKDSECVKISPKVKTSALNEKMFFQIRSLITNITQWQFFYSLI